jgi:hypothetical protein
MHSDMGKEVKKSKTLICVYTHLSVVEKNIAADGHRCTLMWGIPEFKNSYLS